MNARDLSTRPVKMSHQHFRLIAATIAGLKSPAGFMMPRKRIAHQFADALATTNPKFDRARFLAACGVED